MASVNKVILVGYLGKDPETRYMPNGDAVTQLSIATSDKWKDKATGEQKEQTEWHRISLFGRVAEVASQYLKKGSLAYIEGSLRTRKYTKDGVERYSTEIRGERLQLLGGASKSHEPRDERNYEDVKGRARQPQQPEIAGAGAPAKKAHFDDMEDDIPF